jgi:hypothetical protein
MASDDNTSQYLSNLRTPAEELEERPMTIVLTRRVETLDDLRQFIKFCESVHDNTVDALVFVDDRQVMSVELHEGVRNTRFVGTVATFRVVLRCTD